MPPKPPSRVCALDSCASPFRPRRKHQRFCSSPCRKTHHTRAQNHLKVWDEILSAVSADTDLAARCDFAAMDAFVRSLYSDVGKE